MIVTDEALDLIREFEGFRGRAYRCPAGVWTIGYGHTAMAGTPAVTAGMELTRAEADAILRRDVAAVAEGVRRLLRARLSERQFSALVSFAFNVGLGNLASSSVLKAANGGDLDRVPKRLMLWTKARGRTLPGLVRRRAAEAAMFGGDGKAADRHLPEAMAAEEGKRPIRSTTVLAALVAAFCQLTPFAFGGLATVAALVLSLAALAWIVRERRRHAREDGV